MVRVNQLHNYIEYDRRVEKVSGKGKRYHRMVALAECKTEWVPLKVHYLFQNNDHDARFNFIPGEVRGRYDWPQDPTPESMGFLAKMLSTPTCEQSND